MRSGIIVFLFAFGVTNSCLAQSSHSSADDFRGRYVVTDVVGYTDISGGVADAKKALGQVLVISDNAIDFDQGYHCVPNNGFKIKRVNTAVLLKEEYGGITIRDTGLPAKTLMLYSDNCIRVFRMDNYRVVTGANGGVIVRAVRDGAQEQKKRPGRLSK